MYQIVFTKGNEETVLTEVESIESAKEIKKEYSKLPDYSNGLVTIEQKIGQGNQRKIIG
jgi:hypothetical protein